MISDDLANSADFVAGYARRDEPMLPHAAGCLAQVLMDLADQVKHLENVVRLDSQEVSLMPPKRRRANAR